MTLRIVKPVQGIADFLILVLIHDPFYIVLNVVYVCVYNLILCVYRLFFAVYFLSGIGKLRDGSNDICVNINNTNPAVYTFSLVANPEVCTTYPEGYTLATISFVGFGSVSLNMSFHCSCDAVCNPLVISQSSLP